jgi:hypothetical protein
VLPQNFLYVGNISFGVFILTASWQSWKRYVVSWQMSIIL